MSSNNTRTEPYLDPFLHIDSYDVIAWSVFCFLECCYVTASIVKEKISHPTVAALFSMVTLLSVAYLSYYRDLTWILGLNLLSVVVIVHLILFTEDSMCLLAFLSFAKYAPSPFSYVVDVLAILFIIVDIPGLLIENPVWWNTLYICSLMLSACIAKMNSYGPVLHIYCANGVFFFFFGLLCLNASDRTRSIPVFVAIVAYMVLQFNQRATVNFGSLIFSEISQNFILADFHKWYL